MRRSWFGVRPGLRALAIGLAFAGPGLSQAFGQTPPPGEPEMSPQYGRLLVRNASLIDGTGAPIRGPVNIVIERGTIVRIDDVQPIRNAAGMSDRSVESDALADRVIDATGKYVMPGIIDAHAHLHPPLPRDYVYKLYLGNGVTAVRNVDGRFDADTPAPEGILAEKRRIDAGTVVAPRTWAYPFLPITVRTAAEVPALVKAWSDMGVDGIKLVRVDNLYPDMLEALGRETRKHGMGLAAHLPQSASPGVNALIAAADGVTTIEHHYGYAETALAGTTIPVLPHDYSYGDERQRFRETLAIWLQADMKELKARTIPELVKISREGRFTMVPTMVVYEKQRDYTRASNVPWLEPYALPSQLHLWRTPDPTRHGAIFDRWTSNDEAEAAQVYRRWMAFIREYVRQGGHLAVGADSGGPFQMFGFQTIREMELLLEAGLTPLEVIRAATQEGARVLQEPKMGVLRPGYAADLLIVDENPLDNFKVLMGRPGVDAAGRPQRRSLIRNVIVNGRVMDADRLLADVERMVAAGKPTAAP